MNQFLEINFLVHILLILFLWRTLPDRLALAFEGQALQGALFFWAQASEQTVLFIAA